MPLLKRTPNAVQKLPLMTRHWHTTNFNQNTARSNKGSFVCDWFLDIFEGEYVCLRYADECLCVDDCFGLSMRMRFRIPCTVVFGQRVASAFLFLNSPHVIRSFLSVCTEHILAMTDLFPPGAHNYEKKADWESDDQWRVAKAKCHRFDKGNCCVRSCPFIVLVSAAP